MKKEKKQKKQRNNEMLNPTHDVSIEDYMAAKAELDDLKKKQGTAPEEKGLSKLITRFFQGREDREKVLVSRKKLLWMTFLLGWCGGHRFYSKRYVLGVLYAAFCWTGISIAMSIIDLVEYIPIPPDENGNILV